MLSSSGNWAATAPIVDKVDRLSTLTSSSHCPLVMRAVISFSSCLMTPRVILSIDASATLSSGYRLARSSSTAIVRGHCPCPRGQARLLSRPGGAGDRRSAAAPAGDRAGLAELGIGADGGR